MNNARITKKKKPGRSRADKEPCNLARVVEQQPIIAEKKEPPPRRFGIVRAAVTYPVRAIQSMPDLKMPVADPQMLPENANWIASTAAMWIWAWSMFEYKVTRKGFAAWIRVLSPIAICFAVMIGVISGCIAIIGRLSRLANGMIGLLRTCSLVCLWFIGLVMLSYLVYAVTMIFLGKPIRMPRFRVQSTKDDSAGYTCDMPNTDVSIDRNSLEEKASRRRFFDAYVSDD